MFRIAIDGPGGAGKSSVAKIVAQKMKIVYVDTGAMYRAIGLYMLNHGIDTKDCESVVAALKDVRLDVTFRGGQKLFLNGEDVGDRIRTPEVSMAASAVSSIPEVRAFLLQTQKDIASQTGVVMDGRDIGTVILPNADLKIFLTASPTARARRRFDELKAKGIETSLEDVLAEMNKRDEQDAQRNIAPCVPADDAVILDNSDLNLEQTADRILQEAARVNQERKNRKIYLRTYAWMAPLVRFFLHIHVHGQENIPENGGVLVCANHIAVRDVFIIAATFRRPVRFLAKKELFDVPIVGSVIRTFGAVRLDRGGADVGAIRKSIELAKEGNPVAIFPQGHRYPGVNPAETHPKNGAALIAYHAGCPVLPVCLKTKGVKYGLFRRVDVIVGKPIANEKFAFEKGGNEEFTAASERIFGEILKLGGYVALPEGKTENREENQP